MLRRVRPMVHCLTTIPAAFYVQSPHHTIFGHAAYTRYISIFGNVLSVFQKWIAVEVMTFHPRSQRFIIVYSQQETTKTTHPSSRMSHGQLSFIFENFTVYSQTK